MPGASSSLPFCSRVSAAVPRVFCRHPYEYRDYQAWTNVRNLQCQTNQASGSRGSIYFKVHHNMVSIYPNFVAAKNWCLGLGLLTMLMGMTGAFGRINLTSFNRCFFCHS